MTHNNTSDDLLVCSSRIKASDVLIDGTSTTVAQLIAEHNAMKMDIQALKQFVGNMMPPPPLSPPPSPPPPRPIATIWKVSNAGSTPWRPRMNNLRFFSDASCTAPQSISPRREAGLTQRAIAHHRGATCAATGTMNSATLGTKGADWRSTTTRKPPGAPAATHVP